MLRCAPKLSLGGLVITVYAPSITTYKSKNTFAKEQEKPQGERNESLTTTLLCFAFVLTLAPSLSAFAGDMPAGITAQPPSTPHATTQGDMSTGFAGEMTTGVTAIDPATEIVLSLLQGLLALF